MQHQYKPGLKSRLKILFTKYSQNPRNMMHHSERDKGYKTTIINKHDLLLFFTLMHTNSRMRAARIHPVSLDPGKLLGPRH